MRVYTFSPPSPDDSECLLEDLILSFLLVRQTAFETSTLSYEKWFSASFGSLITSKANSKRGFGLLVKFLSSLVPYEPADCLKVRVKQYSLRTMLYDYYQMFLLEDESFTFDLTPD